MSTVTAPVSVLSDLDLRTGTWTVDAVHSAVLFSIRHLGISRVRGRFGTFESTLNVGETLVETSVAATIDLGSINTNNSDRDAHLRSTDFFSVDTNPTMTFASTAISGSGEDWKLTGDITLNGVTKPITFDVEYSGTQSNPSSSLLHAGFSATATLKRSEFGIEFGIMPLGVDRLALADDVKIELDLQFVEPQS